MDSKVKHTLLGFNLDDPHERRLMMEKFATNLNKGMVPKNALGLPDDFLENIYAMAYELLHQGLHEDAKGFFSYLIGLDPAEFKYVFGYAACLHGQKKYVEALQAYTIAMSLDPFSPRPLYFSADCLINLGMVEDAKELLIATMRVSQTMEEDIEYSHKAEILLKQLINNKK